MSLFCINKDELKLALESIDKAGAGSVAIFEAGTTTRPLKDRMMTLVGVTPGEENKNG